jgi:hypothetical protein
MTLAKKTVVWLLIAFAVFYVITQPSQLANIINSIVDLLHRAADSIVTLIQDL